MQNNIRTFWKILQNNEINYYLEFMAIVENVVENKKDLLKDVEITKDDIKCLVSVSKKIRKGIDAGCKKSIMKSKDQYQEILTKEIRKALK